MPRLEVLRASATAARFTRLGFWARRLPPVEIDLSRKTVVVTGATSGLGEATARALAQKGARVCLVGRDAEKLEAVRASFPVPVDTERCDLSLMAEVRQLAQRLCERYPKIDVLVNNVGVLPAARSETREGLELCFATNLLGHFVLTQRLLPTLLKSAPSRIINVSSGGMYTQRIHPEDLQFRQLPWNGPLAYARTKRGQVILTELWAEQLKDRGVVVNAMHPGWADTPGVKTQLPTFYRLTRPLLRTPAQGADTIVWLSAAEEAGQKTGGFFLDRRRQPTHLFSHTHEREEDRRALWQALAKLSGEG